MGSEHLAAQLAELAGCRWIRDCKALKGDGEELMAPRVKAEISHVVFTSGSTGRPKGCVCSCENLWSYCQAKNQVHEVTTWHGNSYEIACFQVKKESVVFVASALTFDPWLGHLFESSGGRSLGDFFATWMAGACVALARQELPLGRSLEATRASHVPCHSLTSGGLP